MGSLQDELRRAGLVKKKPAGRRRRKQGRGQSDGGAPDLAAAYAARAREEARERAEQQAEQERRREANRAVARLIKAVAAPVPDADRHRYFQHRGKIRKVWVSAAQLDALNDGGAGIVELRGRYHVVPANTRDEIARLKPEAVVELDSGEDDGVGSSDYSDPRFEVPEDLSW